MAVTQISDVAKLAAKVRELDGAHGQAVRDAAEQALADKAAAAATGGK